MSTVDLIGIFLFHPKHFTSTGSYLQHFAILLKYVIHVAIPDIPTWVREEISKLDYQRREAFKVNNVTAREQDHFVSQGEVLIDGSSLINIQLIDHALTSFCAVFCIVRIIHCSSCQRSQRCSGPCSSNAGFLVGDLFRSTAVL